MSRGLKIVIESDDRQPAEVAELLRKIAADVEATGLKTGLGDPAFSWDDDYTCHIDRTTFRDRFRRKAREDG